MSYDVEEFFEKHRDLDYLDLINAADRAAMDAKREAHAYDAREFLTRMREILNFLRYNNKPQFISPRDWLLCQTLAQRFVERGILKADVLGLWNSN